MPMQPSTQVTHMPLKGTTESSVLFLVKVAAEAFGFNNEPIFFSFYFSPRLVIYSFLSDLVFLRTYRNRLWCPSSIDNRHALKCMTVPG
jgi:hypothetical protein